MNFRNISSWCIRNPVGPIVLFVGLMLAGLIAFARMQVNNAPDIDFPAAIVSVSQPGAAPNELETQVTQRVEFAIRGVNGVDEINSTVNEGNSTTFVSFQLGTPSDRAVNDVRNAIAQIRSNLPEGILEPQVTRVDAEDEPISYVGAQTTDMTLEQLSWYIDNNVSKRLLGQEGIAAVGRVGGVDRTIRVILDPAALQAQGITAAQVNQQLRQSNMNGAGGRAEIAGSEQSVRVIGNAQDAYALSQTQIALPGGRFVRLADLGQVKDSNSEQRSLAKMNGRQVVTFMIQRAKGSSEVTAYDNAWRELKKLEKENPKVHFSEVFNTVDYTKAQYRSAMEGLVEGAALAVLVVLLFLRDIRATAISAVSIPLSAIPAFWFMSLMGITMNFMSTMAMGLVAGVLVDDAIVEIENIVRHMRMGKSAYQAALDAADEIGLAVLATTMAIVAVFLPVALMPGIAGQYFKAFGFTVVLSVLMSLFVARMITPLIAAYFLRSHGAQPHAAWKWMDVYLKVLNWSLDTTKANALLARLPRPSRRVGYYALGALLLLPVVGVFFGGTGAVMMATGKAAIPGAIGFVIAVLVAAGVAWGTAKLIIFLVQAFASHEFAEWHGIMVARWNARMQDHRLAMVGAGLATLLLSVVLFGTLSLSFFPPQNDDYSRVNITMPPGTTLKQTEAVDGPGGGARLERSERRAGLRAREHRDGPREHRAQEEPQDHEHPVRAESRADAVRVPRCPRQLHEPERRRAGQRPARHHALPRRRRSGATDRGREPYRQGDGNRAGPARATRRQPARPAGDHHQAALRSRRRSRRHDRSAEPDDPNRDAWATSSRTARNSRCPIARCRSRSRCRRMRGATSRRSRTCPFRPPAAARYR